jgi:putative ABC transport system permease protein
MIKRLFTLAFKNIFRARNRTMITIIAYAFGIGLYVFMNSLLTGFYNTSVKNIIDKDIGKIKVMGNDYNLDDAVPLPETYFEYTKYTDISKQYEYCSPDMQFIASIITSDVSAKTVIRGVETDKANSVFHYSNDIVEGVWIDQCNDNEVVIGGRIAHSLNLKLGDVFTLIFKNRDGNFDAFDLNVGGIISTGNPNIDRLSIFMPLAKAQEFMSANGLISGISIKTKKYNTEKIKINETFTGVSAYTWEDLSEDFLNLDKMKSGFSSILIFMIVIVATVGIFNTILLGMFERKREVGMLKAMGMSRRQIELLFSIEGGIIGFVGSVAGIAFGFLINLPFVIKGFDISMYGDMDVGYPVQGVVKSLWGFEFIIPALILGVIIAVLASYYPARRAARLEPVKTLRD